MVNANAIILLPRASLIIPITVKHLSGVAGPQRIGIAKK